MERNFSNLVLVLGGARSGKSEFAEKLVENLGERRLYLATGAAGDDEMRKRIAGHRARRGDGWTTVEEPLEIEKHLVGQVPLLLDCLTLWLSNVMFAGREVSVATEQMLRAIGARPGPVVVVSNEIGMGLVPDTELGRKFRDAQGHLNQAVAADAGAVAFVAAGLPIWLKGAAP